jgi:DNA-binding CsgD family transcriptional regulator
MTADTALDRARDAFRRRSWTAAVEAYAAADRESPLELEDLQEAGLATHLIGDDDGAADLFVRAHEAALAAADKQRAARIAFWLGMMRAQRGDMAVAGGWLARAGRLVEEGGVDCVERGLLLVPAGIRALDSGDPAAALQLFGEAAAIAERFDDGELATMARLGRGRSLIGLGEVRDGVELLDEAMVAVTADEVGPVVAGIVYCASIEAFHEIFDLRRAQQWTDALTRWCASQPDLAPFRGRCLVYRAELKRLHGSWSEAVDEARRAEEWLSRPPPEPAVGEAHYEQAEVLRLRGDLVAAEAAYREAARWGRRAEPGLALLRLAQGQASAALAMIRRALTEAESDVARSPALLEPAVEIAIAAGDTELAGASAGQLDRLARLTGAPFLRAAAERAEGSIRLAGGDPAAALAALRRAASAWQEVDAPYELARTRASIGLALRALGDEVGGDVELDAARSTFRSLGAEPDLRALDRAVGVASRPAGLSEREVEVLRLLAEGLTNRGIAERLVISERTVDRHVSNIFSKLDVTSRAAATAAAYERGVIEG